MILRKTGSFFTKIGYTNVTLGFVIGFIFYLFIYLLEREVFIDKWWSPQNKHQYNLTRKQTTQDRPTKYKSRRFELDKTFYKGQDTPNRHFHPGWALRFAEEDPSAVTLRLLTHIDLQIATTYRQMFGPFQAQPSPPSEASFLMLHKARRYCSCAPGGRNDGNTIGVGSSIFDSRSGTLFAVLLMKFASHHWTCIKARIKFLQYIMHYHERLPYLWWESTMVRQSPSITICWRLIFLQILIPSSRACNSASRALPAATFPALSIMRVPAALRMIPPIPPHWVNGLKEPSKYNLTWLPGGGSHMSGGTLECRTVEEMKLE